MTATADPDSTLRDELLSKAREVLARRDEPPVESDLPAIAEEVVWEVACERDDDDDGEWFDDDATDLVWRAVIDATDEAGGLRGDLR